MSFAADAIGFYLQLDNTLSPELQRASNDYERFTKSLTKWNAQAYTSANKGFGALTRLVKSFEALPNTAAASYRKALAKIRKVVKPITQPLILELSPKGAKSIGRAVTMAVTKALRKTTLRLSATIPLKRNKFFDTSIALRSAYKDMTQPPDMRGVFQGLPKFAKGGIVPGAGGIDDVLALLTPGEAVLPVDVVKELQTMAKGKFVSKGLAEAMANIENIATASEKLKDLAELGLDPKAQSKYNVAMDALNVHLVGAREHFTKMPQSMQKMLLPALKKATGQVKAFQEEGEEAEDTFSNLFKKILGPTRFAAIHRALGSMQQAFGGVRSAAGEVADQVGISTDATQSLSESMFEANTKLGMTRETLYSTTEALIANTRALYGNAVNADEVGRAYLAMTEAGETNVDVLKEMAPLAAMTAKAFGTDAGGVAESMYRLNDAFGLSRDEIAATFTTFGRFAQQTPLDFEQFREKMMSQINEGGLGAFLSELKDPAMKKGVIEQFALISGSLAQNWGELGGEMAQIMSQALTDPAEYGPQFTKLTGLTVDQLRNSLASGQGVEVIEAMTQRMAKFAGDTTQNMKPVLEALNFEGTAEQFVNLARNGDQIVATAKKLRASIAPVAEGMAELSERSQATRGSWTGFKDSVGLWFSEKFGIRLGEFFDDFNPQVIVSTGYLAKMGVESLIAGKRLIFGIGSSVLKVGKNLMSSMGVFKKASAGVTTLATGAGAAGGAVGGGGFLTGFAAGLTALAPALTTFGAAMMGPGGLGLLALVGVGFSVAAMARIAAPAIVAIGEAIGKAVTPMFDAFKSMSAGQIAATAASLLLIGPAFLGIGVGVVGLSAGLALSVPGFMLFAGAMKVLNPTGVSGSVGNIISTLLDTFNVDQAKLDAALKAMTGSVRFITGLAVVAATITGLAAGAMVGKAVDLILWGFGAKSPLESLSDQTTSIKRTVNKLVSKFNFSNSEIKALDNVSGTVKAVAEFTVNYNKITQSLRSISPTYLGRATESIMDFFGVDSPMAALAGKASGITGVIRSLVAEFFFLDKGLGGADAAIHAIKVSAEVVRGLNPLALAVAETGENIGALQDGWIFSGALTTIVAGMEPFRKGIVSIVGEMALLKQNIGGMTAETLKTTSDVATQAVSGLVKPVAGIKALAGMLRNVREDAKSIITQRGKTAAAIRAAVSTAKNLRQELSSPVLAHGEISQTTRMELDPSTSDKPVHDALIRSNELLAEIVAAIKGGRPVRVAGAGTRSGPRTKGIDPDVATIANGGL